MCPIPVLTTRLRVGLELIRVDGRGYVKIEDAEKYGLSNGYELNVNSTHTEPAYMLSVFHQLHCLVCPLLSPDDCKLTPSSHTSR